MASLFFCPPLSSYVGDEANPCSSTCSGACPGSATQDVLQFPWGFSTWSQLSVIPSISHLSLRHSHSVSQHCSMFCDFVHMGTE